ncbi:DUF6119 family protein [Flavobacterium sp.]|uniref:DUF6119 family protein n=1 Tax=Flavobacterium sp. TaxID=239 RepID=UPI0026112C78|nr:DUF6119 family protein [Flavobacterium sp.]
MSDKVNAKLYRLQDNLIQIYGNTENIIQTIVELYNDKTGHDFKNINLRENLNQIISTDEEGNNYSYNAKLYVLNTKEKKPDWIDFANTIAQDNAELEEFKNRYSSFLLFVYDENSAFAISKGYYGHHLLIEHIDIFFGMEVLSRLIDKSSTEIRQIEDRALFGSELGAQRFFRENYNLAYDDDFGKIYKSMLAAIKVEDFEKLGILKKRETTKQVSILGNSSLEISTNFSYKELLNRITKIKRLLLTKGVDFNQFYRVPQKELSLIKEILNKEILKMSYLNYLTDGEVDFYHPEIFEYLSSSTTLFINQDTAASVEIEMSSSKKFKDLIDEIGEDLIDISSEENFIKSLNETYGSYKVNEESDYIKEISLSQWISGEVEYNGKKYFKVDNQWYAYKDSLDNLLNERFNNMNFESLAPVLQLKDWNQFECSSEGLFNESFINSPGFIVTDRTYMTQIEVADLIRVTNDELFFYHIKKGLGQDMRVLSNQIINASRYLKFAIDEVSNNSLSNYFNSISNKHYEKGNIKYTNTDGVATELDLNSFIELMKSNRKINFVFVYATSSALTINEEIINTNSRIAKLSLIYTIRDMKRTDFQFLVERIKLI